MNFKTKLDVKIDNVANISKYAEFVVYFNKVVILQTSIVKYLSATVNLHQVATLETKIQKVGLYSINYG